MLLSDATETQLIEALRAKMPKTLFGHEVETVVLRLSPSGDVTHHSAHLRFTDRRIAVGSVEGPTVSELESPRAHWCVFSPKPPGGEHQLIASGTPDIFSPCN